MLKIYEKMPKTCLTNSKTIHLFQKIIQLLYKPKIIQLFYKIKIIHLFKKITLIHLFHNLRYLIFFIFNNNYKIIHLNLQNIWFINIKKYN